MFLQCTVGVKAHGGRSTCSVVGKHDNIGGRASHQIPEISDDAIRKTVRLFYQRMPSPGYLFVAAAESLLKLTTDFELQEIGGAFVYVKRDS